MTPYAIAAGVTILGASGGVGLLLCCQELVCRHREKRHQLQLWRAFAVGYRKGAEDYLRGEDLPSHAARFTPFNPLDRKKQRGWTLTANTLVASRIGRIEGWLMQMRYAEVPKDPTVDEQIAEGVDELMEWSHEEHQRRAA